MISEGSLTAKEMFTVAHMQNTMRTWALRGGGWLMMFFALMMILGPLTTMAGVIPCVGGMLGSIATCGACLVAITLSIAFSGITIAVAWIWYRPLMAIGLIAGAMVPLVMMVMRKNDAPAAGAAGGQYGGGGAAPAGYSQAQAQGQGQGQGQGSIPMAQPVNDPPFNPNAYGQGGGGGGYGGGGGGGSSLFDSAANGMGGRKTHSN